MIQADAVTADELGLNILDKNVERLLLGPELRLDNTDDAVHGLTQRDMIQVQCQLAAFNFGHVQHIVDKPQKMLAGQRDFFQAVPDLLGIVYVGGGDGRHAHNGVHGGADIVAHIGQELALGAVGMLCRRPGLRQSDHLAL